MKKYQPLAPEEGEEISLTEEPIATDDSVGGSEGSSIATHGIIAKQTPTRYVKEDHAGFWAKVTHTWGQGLLVLGYRKTIEAEDLYEIPTFLLAQNQDFQVNWDYKWPVVQSMIRHFIPKHKLAIFIKIMLIILVCINPLILMVLLTTVKSGQDGEGFFGNMWVQAICFFIGKTLQSTFTQYYYWCSMKIGGQSRAAIMALVYKKGIKMSLRGKKDGKFSAGSIVNLMAVDAEAVMTAFWDHVHDTWSCTIMTMLLLAELCAIVGVSGLLGFLFMLSIGPVSGKLAKRSSVAREAALASSDQRVKLLMEVLQGIRLLKLYAWEKPFAARVRTFRANHEAFIKKYIGLACWNLFAAALLPGIVLTSTFTCYILTGHTLTTEVAFTAVALFVSIKDPLWRLSWAVEGGIQFFISGKHIEEFLRSDEVNQPEEVKKTKIDRPIDIVIKNGEFWWGDVVKSETSMSVSNDDEIEKEELVTRDGASDTTKEIEMVDVSPTLHNIDFKAPAGKLTCIVGPVGSGKSTLLLALLREITAHNGSLNLPQNVGYTPQSPWLITATLKENVLFGDDLDEDRYQKVIEACALKKDLEILPAGDSTEIGEQGINLSGGQKQRVSLARALYHNAPCYILDEPLSAVDAHVATWLFDKCIGGMMAGATRVLVTHQLQFLPKADHIVVLNNGRITNSGSYEDLISQGVDFSTLVKKKFQSDDDESKPKDDVDSVKTENSEESEKAENAETEVGGISPNMEQKNLDPSKNNNTNPAAGSIISAEERQVGQVGLDIYLQYFKAAGSSWRVIGLVTVYVMAQLTTASSDYWLTLWSQNSLSFSSPLYYIYVYFGIGVTYALLRRLALFFVQLVACSSANNLHERLLTSIFGARVSFFDMTPAGRVINRFSKDQNTLDSQLPYVLQDCLECGVYVICNLGIICVVTPLFTIPLVILLIAYYYIQKFYRCSSRELKRLDSISRSPIFSHFSETFTGATVIRAFKKQHLFVDQMDQKIDVCTKMLYNAFVVNRWLGFRLELIGCLFVLFASIFALMARDTLNPGLVGFVLVCSLSLSGSLNWAVRQVAELEVNMNAVERLLHYINNIPQEEQTQFQIQAKSTSSPNKEGYTNLAEISVGIDDKVEVDDKWPASGGVRVQNLVVKYREDLDPVLKGISFEIKGGEKVGIVGRTGAGKSTLTTALFRLVEPTAGTVIIDGVDISKLDLCTLRSRISIIPQDPVIFSGSIKSNLDPFMKHDDFELWKVLDQVHLKSYVEKLPEKLNNPVHENGDGFSVGQRQLLCLGRALLRQTQILVMDEATASLDFNTDMLIKNTIKECFTGKTLIVIAHRLDTILDSDKIAVFEQGEIAEFGSPQSLLENANSHFYSLVQSAKQSAKYVK